MRELTASEILGVWERGRRQTLPERALELLAAGGCSEPPELLTVGRRDALLLTLRELTLGASFTAVVTCGSCGELLEIDLAAADLRGRPAPPSVEPLELKLDGRSLRLRLPTAADLVAIAGAADVDDARALLLDRCLVEGQRATEDEETVTAWMAEADAGAWIELELTCPACAAAFGATFDVVSFFWAEVDACARRLVRDVHVLASAYGWRESDVLSLSADRREAYMELVGA
jgi:hypothetical protein